MTKVSSLINQKWNTMKWSEMIIAIKINEDTKEQAKKNHL